MVQLPFSHELPYPLRCNVQGSGSLSRRQPFTLLDGHVGSPPSTQKAASLTPERANGWPSYQRLESWFSLPYAAYSNTIVLYILALCRLFTVGTRL